VVRQKAIPQKARGSLNSFFMIASKKKIIPSAVHPMAISNNISKKLLAAKDRNFRSLSVYCAYLLIEPSSVTKTAMIVTAATDRGIMLTIAYAEPFSPALSIIDLVTIAAITPTIAEIIPDRSNAAAILFFTLLKACVFSVRLSGFISDVVFGVSECLSGRELMFPR